MRYIKWNKDAGSASCRGQYAEAMEQQEKQEKKRRWADKWATVIFLTVHILVWVAGAFLIIQYVTRELNGLWDAILRMVLSIVLSCAVFLAGPLLGAWAANRLWKRMDRNNRQISRKLKEEGCRAIRAFYGFSKPFLVTKCFDSTDRKFRRHDVCLFFADGTLRLSANLHYPMFDPERDLGCYIFEEGEYTLTQVDRGGSAATELRSGETVFLLGSRAMEWIGREEI